MSDITAKETTRTEAVGERGMTRPGFASLVIERLLSRLDCGSLLIVLPNGHRLSLRGEAPGPSGSLVLHRWRVLRRLLLAGDIGFAEAYMDGDWSSPDITTLIELIARNQASIPGVDGGAPTSRWINRLRFMARANTLSGSKRNIVEHYDLGNAFYERWLDKSMSYSSALFESSGQSLEDAQSTKQDRVLDMLDLQPGQSVLEIGFGWGGLAEGMAKVGNHVTGLTLSPSQHDYAENRLKAAGLSHRADLRQLDYRKVGGSFDRIVSIEMLEAVGESWWPVYFDTLRSRLRPGGTIVLQTITIADERFASYRRSVDFIQRYIFPGGMLPSPRVLREEVEKAGLVVEAVETFGASYGHTLRLWQERFQAAWPEIAKLGFPLRFKRMWEYYLSYCEAGFRAGAIDVGLWRLGHRK